MATNYPAAADDNTTLPNPTASSATNSPSLSAGQSNQNDAIKALEAKLGTGASTPVVSRLLFGTGTGTSAWTQLTSAQLAASLTDETGTGSAVFATTPTLITPKVDTINESTPANGVTIDGLNIKDNKLNTNDSVVTTNITDANVTTAKLAANAVSKVTNVFNEVAATTQSIGTSFADVTNWTGGSLTTSGGTVLFFLSLTYFKATVPSNLSGFRIVVDSTNVPSATGSIQYTNEASSHKMFSRTLVLTGLGSGVHTVKVQAMSVASATTNFDVNDLLNLTALELQR